MTVLFSISYYLPYISGLTLAASRWAVGLAKAGETVTVLAMSGKAKSRSAGRVRVVIAKPLIKISKGFISLDWWIKSWQLAGVHDVTVINLPQFEGIVTALFAKLQGKRVVSIYHCEIVMPPGNLSSIIQSLVEVSNFCTLWCSDAVVTYTKDYEKHSRLLSLLARYGKRHVVTIVPPIPKPKASAIKTRSIQRSIGKSTLIVGIAARLAAEKGVEYILAAIPRIRALTGRGVKIAIAGPMDPVGEVVYKATIMELVRKYKTSVCFLGSIAPEEMGSFYRSIDVLALPSINSTEAFGMVQVEAMHYGIPVVASNLPGVRVPVQKTGMGKLVTPKDTEEIAEAIVSVVSDRERYRVNAARVGTIFSQRRSIRALIRSCRKP